MIPFEEARAHVLAGCPVGEVVEVPLAEALGLALAEPVAARVDVPAFANSAMDGFAVRAADTVGASESATRPLRLVGTVRAGEVATRAVGPGEAMRIMTGAPVPDGADAIVMVERATVVSADANADADPDADPCPDEVVQVEVQVAAGLHIRTAGSDLFAGAEVFGAGEVLTPAHLGVLASVGVASVRAVPRLRVGVFTTGDELVPVGQALGPGQIHDSNRRALLALLTESGFTPVDLGLVVDDEDAIAATIRAGVDGTPDTPPCDALITTGGVSMGDYDFVKVVLDRIGDMRWMQVAIKPAKPLAFGTVAPRHDGPNGDLAHDRAPVPVFGLPGNPVSSIVSFELFARPALRRMAGIPADRIDRPRVVAVADDGLARRVDGKTHFVRVSGGAGPDGRWHVASAGGQGSHQLSAVARATALAVLPDGDGVAPGGDVDVLLLHQQ